MKEVVELLIEEAERRTREYDIDHFMHYTALFFRYVAAWIQKEHTS